MLWPSPISVHISSNKVRDESSSAKMNEHIWFRITDNAKVFIVTVFPPALAPLRTRTLVPLSNDIVTGTAFIPNNGWRQERREIFSPLWGCLALFFKAQRAKT